MLFLVVINFQIKYTLKFYVHGIVNINVRRCVLIATAGVTCLLNYVANYKKTRLYASSYFLPVETRSNGIMHDIHVEFYVNTDILKSVLRLI